MNKIMDKLVTTSLLENEIATAEKLSLAHISAYFRQIARYLRSIAQKSALKSTFSRDTLHSPTDS